MNRHETSETPVQDSDDATTQGLAERLNQQCFSESPVFVSEADIARMERIVSAVGVSRCRAQLGAGDCRFRPGTDRRLHGL